MKRRWGKNRKYKRGTPPGGLTRSKRGCKHKKKYRTLEDARADLDILRGNIVQIEGVGVDGGTLDVYPCYQCRTYHIGHRRPLEG